jgi:hypothetical protein
VSRRAEVLDALPALRHRSPALRKGNHGDTENTEG